MICPRCRIDLPGRVTHDTPEECVASLRGRLDMTRDELRDTKRRASNLATRVDSWKIKAKATTPGKKSATSSRLDRLENRCVYSAGKLRDLETRLVKAEQRAAFAVKQVEFLQERRAS